MQRNVTKSTVESEYVSCSESTAEIIYLRKILNELGRLGKYLTLMYGDSKGSILLARNNVFHSRTKHIGIAYHYSRSRVNEGDIELIYISTDDNVADLFTKPVSRKMFIRLFKLIGLK